MDDDELAILGHLNRLEFERSTARWSGRDGAVVERDGVLSWQSATDFPVLLNGAAALDPAVDAVDVVRVASDRFGSIGRGFSMSLRDGHPRDDRIRAAALEAGLVELSGAPEMAVSAPVDEREQPGDVELHWLAHDTLDGLGSSPPVTARDFLGVSDAAYQSLGMPAGTIRVAVPDTHLVTTPGTSIVVATIDGAPVAAAMVLLSHGIAGVYFVGTLDAARGRGLGDLVTRAVTNRAFDEGARAVTLQASSMGEAIYARMGYRELYRYTTFARFAGT